MTGIPLWFRYKCKVDIQGKASLQLGPFALTGRNYSKIIRKQKELVQNLGKVVFTMKEFNRFRPLLQRLLVLVPSRRATL